MACKLTQERRLAQVKSRVKLIAHANQRELKKKARLGVYAERRAFVGYQNPRYY